jgi:hypothetical protein
VTSPSAQPAGDPQDEDQDLGHRAIEGLGDLVLELDLGQRFGKPRILLDRNCVCPRSIDDFLANRPAPLGDERGVPGRS